MTYGKVSLRFFITAVLFGAQALYAAPQIDPALRNTLASLNSNQPIPVVLVFRDAAPLPNANFVPAQRSMVQNMMMKNAEASQASFLGRLRQLQVTDSVPYQMKRYWLTNSVALYAPIRVIKELATRNDIVNIVANRMFRVIPSYRGGLPFQKESFTYGLQKLQIPELRAKAPQIDGRGVRVGILDTGVDATHPDISGKVVVFRDFISKKQNPYDDHGHGTHVAGTISGGNTSGTAIGVAPGVKLVIGKIFDSNGSSTEANIQDAMQWIADPDGNPSTNDAPTLVSNSWGGGPPSASSDPAIEPECRAVDAWVKLGILPVFAAGNDGSGGGTVGLPGACPNALTVGATDQSDRVARFSSRGPVTWKTGSMIKPTISAPGVDIISAKPGGGYQSMSGTSMATPHTAGLAALVYQMIPNSTPMSVIKAISEGSANIGKGGSVPNNDFGFGRIDALGSIKMILGIN